MLTAADLIQSLKKKIHNAGGKIGDEPQLYRILNEASRKLRGSVKMIGTKRHGLPILVVDGIFEYPAPSDIEFVKMIEMYDESEIRLQMESTDPKHFHKARNPFNFERRTFHNPLGKSRDGVYAVEFENGSPYLLMRTTFKNRPKVTLNACDSFNGNGTWVASGDASNVRTDTQRYQEGSGSVAFDGAGTSLVLTNSTMDAVDISGIGNNGTAFFSLYVPSTPPASVTLKVGTDASNYYQKQVTVRNNGLAFRQGYNLIGFDLSSSTETGSVTDASSGYLQMTIANTSSVTATGYRLDAIVLGRGVEITPKYYSRFIVQGDDGVRQSEFDASDDVSVLYENEDDLLIEEAAIIALKELREFKEATVRAQTHAQDIEVYRANNPEQQDIQSISYYRT